jgi:hypothetical protein
MNQVWLTTFTTRHGNICVRFGGRVLNIQACAVAKPVVELIKRYPATAGVAGVLLPILLQLYLASKEPKK